MALDGWFAGNVCYADAYAAANAIAGTFAHTGFDGTVTPCMAPVLYPGTSITPGLPAVFNVCVSYQPYGGTAYGTTEYFAAMPCEVDMSNVFQLTVAQGTEIGLAVMLACAIAWAVRKIADVFGSEEEHE